MEQKTNVHKRISKRKLTEYNRTLSVRDKEILVSVRQCRFLQTDQVGRLHFQESSTSAAGLRAATRVLTKLQGLGLVQTLARRIGGVRAGSTSYAWTLKAAGAAFLDLDAGRSSGHCRKRVFEPDYIFLKHTLAEVYVRLHNISGTKLLKTELEPDCWRSYTDPYGVTSCLKPDLYAVIAGGGYEDHFFFEVDLDTEAPSRVIRKCEHYGRYYLSEAEQRRSGIFPRVVWLAPDAKRRETLIRHIGENLNSYNNLFAVITLGDLDELVRNGTISGGICHTENEYILGETTFQEGGRAYE